MKTILSVGIDIGTSTTQVIFSRLGMENTAGYFTVPHVSIVDKQVIYKGGIFETPLNNRYLIDGAAVREIVSGEFEKAGFFPKDTDTGAVIITGESARKENAAEVLSHLSSFAGEFVVSTAGPDLEAIIAGKGSGASLFSQENYTTAVNIDIGGGTSNVAVFDCGDVVSKSCVDIGGRQIRLDKDYTVTYVSESAAKIASHAGIRLKEGEKTSEESLCRICDIMAELLEELISEKTPSELLRSVMTSGTSELSVIKPIKAVCFSGGVADLVYGSEQDKLKYGDIGVYLGEAIKRGRFFSDYRVIRASETIRATVVGAGTYTTSVSGSTIDYTDGLFPLKNVPVLYLNEAEQKSCFEGKTKLLEEKVRWFLEQSDSERIVVAMKGEPNPSYMRIKNLSGTLSDVLDRCLPKGEPLILVFEHDIAKVTGNLIRNSLTDRAIISIDSVKVEQNDFIDMGKPLMDGLVVPVVVKTLIFN